MTDRDAIEATISALVLIREAAKRDAKTNEGAAAIVRALPIAIKALEDELKKGESHGYS